MTTESSPEKPARASGVSRPGISAADKYAELEDRGEERPLCKCHGETMGWKMEGRTNRTKGGRWECLVANRKRSEGRVHKWRPYKPRARKPRKHRPVCSVDGCEKKHSANGYCGSHYYRFVKYGDPFVSQHRPRCHPVFDDLGIAHCSHGEMRLHGRQWRCPDKQRQHRADHAARPGAREEREDQNERLRTYKRKLADDRDQAKFDALASRYPEIAALITKPEGNE